jgi:hypothetical protein
MPIFQPGSKTYSIFYLKCPRCHEGDTFETGSWSFKKSFDMYQHCPKCDLDYFPEPGFYYGSMFISYIWTGWMSLLIVALLNWWLGFSQIAAFVVLFFFLLINFVYIFRISRLMWLNIHVKYDPDSLKKD